MTDITWGGVLATASDRLQRRAEGASWRSSEDRRLPSGRASVGGQVKAGAMSYAVSGKAAYHAIAAGNTLLFSYALP